MGVSENHDIGYEEGHWYMVPIGRKAYKAPLVPGRFTGLTTPCPRPGEYDHTFPHPGRANFENILLPKRVCGYEGANWVNRGYNAGGYYESYVPSFREVSASELWQVEALEASQLVIAGQQIRREIICPNGEILEIRRKPAKKGSDLAGNYEIHVIDPKTGEEKRGIYIHPAGKGRVRDLIIQNHPGWYIERLARTNKEPIDDNPEEEGL